MSLSSRRLSNNYRQRRPAAASHRNTCRGNCLRAICNSETSPATKVRRWREESSQQLRLIKAAMPTAAFLMPGNFARRAVIRISARRERMLRQFVRSKKVGGRKHFPATRVAARRPHHVLVAPPPQNGDPGASPIPASRRQRIPADSDRNSS